MSFVVGLVLGGLAGGAAGYSSGVSEGETRYYSRVVEVVRDILLEWFEDDTINPYFPSDVTSDYIASADAETLFRLMNTVLTNIVTGGGVSPTPTPMQQALYILYRKIVAMTGHPVIL